MFRKHAGHLIEVVVALGATATITGAVFALLALDCWAVTQLAPEPPSRELVYHTMNIAPSKQEGQISETSAWCFQAR